MDAIAGALRVDWVGNPGAGKSTIINSILVDRLNSGKYKTDSFYYINKDYALEDGDSELINIDLDLKSYIFEKSLTMDIPQYSVKALDADYFEVLKAKSAKKTADLVEQKRVSAENQRLYEKALEQVRRY